MKILISQIAILLLVGQIITNSINNSNVETQTIETQTIDEHSDDFCGSYECIECDKKYNVDNQFEKEDGKCKNYCDICENPQYEYGEDKIHMDELLKEVEEEKVEYVYEEEEETCSIKLHFKYHTKNGTIYYNRFRPTEHHYKCNVRKFYEENRMIG